MKKLNVLITGANGELGHGLIPKLAAEGSYDIYTLDLREMDPAYTKYCKKSFKGSVADFSLIEEVENSASYDIIFHLAAILSTGGEKNPELAHTVNVNGSFLLLSLAKRQSEKRGTPTKFIFPSTIAVYGIHSIEDKTGSPEVTEDQFSHPITMYGINKRYVEEMGRYFSSNYKLLDTSNTNIKIDFRVLRYPGIISANTVPSGGTSDYGPEMIHNAAQNIPYNCFVRPDARLPFIVMPDAVDAIYKLALAPKEALTRQIYNVGSFSVSAEEIQAQVLKFFPEAKIGYEIHEMRQKIVDSWPGDVNDTPARNDWGWLPKFGVDDSFNKYIIPAIKARYSQTEKLASNGS